MKQYRMIQLFIASIMISAPMIPVFADPYPSSIFPGTVPGSFDFFGIESLFYEQSFMPDGSQLLGSWIHVGVAILPGYPSKTLPRDVCDLSGLKNRDGSVMQLTFSRERDFADHDYLSVRLFHLGGNEYAQGPFAVLYSQEGAKFWQSGYQTDPNGTVQISATQIEFTCRILASRAPRMLCQTRPFVANSSSDPANVPYNRKTVFYYGFQKML